MGKTFQLTFASLICALSVALMWLSSFFPTLSLTIVAISGILIIAVLLECGYKSAILCFAATALLSVAIVPDKVNVIFYIFILGSYPIVKSFLEKIRNIKISYFVKLVYCIFLLFVLYFAFTGVVLQFIPMSDFILPILLVGGSLFFLIYDMALTKLIVFYLLRIQPKFKHH